MNFCIRNVTAVGLETSLDYNHVRESRLNTVRPIVESAESTESSESATIRHTN